MKTRRAPGNKAGQDSTEQLVGGGGHWELVGSWVQVYSYRGASQGQRRKRTQDIELAIQSSLGFSEPFHPPTSGSTCIH